MKSRRFKKGFTLVELLVVIAILAVLAGVSVIAYFGFTSQARTSADEQAVTQMNIALEAQEAIDAPENVEEAKDVLEAAGFTVDDYVPLDKDNIFYYDKNEVRVLIFDQEEEKVTFPQELADLYSDVTDRQGFWFPLNDKTYVWDQISSDVTANDFKDAIVNADDTTLFKLTGDLKSYDASFAGDYGIKYFITNANGQANIDLGGHTWTIVPGLHVGGFTGAWAQNDITNKMPETSDVTISNGTIVIGSYQYGFTVNDGSSLTFDNCNIVTPSNANMIADYNQFNVADGGRLTITNCVVDGSQGTTTSVYLGGYRSEVNIFDSTLTSTEYGITSNASTHDSWDIRVKVLNSTITTTNGPAVLVNVPGSYTFESSKFTGAGHGVVIRGGNAVIKNSSIFESGKNLDTLDNWEISQLSATDDVFKDGLWIDGNGVQMGGLIVGDWAKAYDYDATCQLVNTEVHMDDTWADLPVVYLSQDSGNTTSLDYDDASTFFKGDTKLTAEDAVKVNSKTTDLPDGLTLGTILVKGATK